MSGRVRTSAFALGLALLSFPVMVAIQARALVRGCETYNCPPNWHWWQSLDWVTSSIGSVAMLAAGFVASSLAWSAGSVALRVLRLTLVSLLIAFPAASLVITVVLVAAMGLKGVVLIPVLFATTLIFAVEKFGMLAFLVTVSWSLAYATYEHRRYSR